MDETPIIPEVPVTVAPEATQSAPVEPVITPSSIVADPTPESAPLVITPVTDPLNPEKAPAPIKKSNKGLMVVLAFIILALVILAVVTVMALQSGNKSTSGNATPSSPTQAASAPTATPTPENGISAADKTTDIQKALDQTTIVDPATDVNTLTTDINQL